MKGIGTVLKVIGIIALALVVLIAVLLFWLSRRPFVPNSCYEMTFFNRKSQRTFTCQIVQNTKRHLKEAKTMQISGIGHSVIRGLGTTGQWFSASTTVYPRGSPQGRRHSYFVDY